MSELKRGKGNDGGVGSLQLGTWGLMGFFFFFLMMDARGDTIIIVVVSGDPETCMCCRGCFSSCQLILLCM